MSRSTKPIRPPSAQPANATATLFAEIALRCSILMQQPLGSKAATALRAATDQFQAALMAHRDGK